MMNKFLQKETQNNKGANSIHNSNGLRTVLIVISLLLLLFGITKAQNVTGFGYTTYTGVNSGTLNYGTISNPFTITYSGGTWKTRTSATYLPITTPSSLSNYVQPANMLELGAWVSLNPAMPPFPTATYTFATTLPASTVLFIQDVDALESFEIEFLDASGSVINPGTLGTYNFSSPAVSTANFSSTKLTVTATNNTNYGESLSDFAINSGLVKQVRITQIASRDDLAASGTAEFYFAAPPPPTTDSESSLNNPTGSNVTLDLLAGDLLKDGSQSSPALVTVNFIAPAGGTVSGNTITVPGEGVWTYLPSTGMITFSPEAGFTGNPTPLTYTITEISTGLTSNVSSESVTYSSLPVDLISFSGKQIDERIALTWRTANEVNFSHFEIFKSDYTGKNFASIAKVISSNKNIYNYTDSEPNESINYYKLKMIDLDGSSKTSRIIVVTFRNGLGSSGQEQTATLHAEKEINVYPNPASEIFYLNNVDFETIKSVEVINALGGIVQTKTSFVTSGIDISQLSSGIYFAKIILTDGTYSTQKIVIE